MKAILYQKYGSPDVLTMKEVARPTIGDKEVLIRIHATTVTAVDCTFRSGASFMARLFTGLFKPRNPILGTELSGEVEAVGKDVTRFSPGDRVFASPPDGFGAHAEYISLPADGAVATLPANMTWQEAAAICNGGLTALAFLRDHGKIAAGQKVLINGAAGSIGTFAVQLARHFGAHVTGVSGPANIDLVKSLGADAVVDYTREDFAASGETYDIIFDTVGKSSLAKSRAALAANGVYLSTVPTAALLLHMVWTSIRGGRKAIFAATGLRPPADQASDMAFLTKRIEAGELKTVIDRTYPLARIAEAHAYVGTGHKAGNVVVTVGP